jgi:hypothetical protein
MIPQILILFKRSPLVNPDVNPENSDRLLLRVKTITFVAVQNKPLMRRQ